LTKITPLRGAVGGGGIVPVSFHPPLPRYIRFADRNVGSIPRTSCSSFPFYPFNLFNPFPFLQKNSLHLFITPLFMKII
jgi:hypothetical protein